MSPLRWSKSKLSLAQLCGFAFAESLKGKPRPPHPALAGGSASHGAIAELVRVVIADEPIDVRRIARAHAPGRPDELADVVAILTLLQEELAEEPPPFRPEAVLHLEERLEMAIGPYVYDGHPDLVEAYGRVAHVTDWKTHWRPMSQAAFEADAEVPRYALLVDAEHPGRFDRFVVRKRFVRYRGAVREMTIDQAQLDMVKWDLIQEIEDAEVRVEALRLGGTLKATPGDWCTLCTYTDICPVLTDFRERGFELAFDDDAGAAEAAGVMRVLDAHSAKLKRLLKTYLGGDHKTGRVELAGGSYGYGPAHHKRADVEDVVEVFEAHDRPINLHALRVDVDALKRSMDREPGKVRRAMAAAIHEYDQPDCRYRRADGTKEGDE